MTRLDRARQFAPFDAMKGLQEALRDREERHLREPKREITEEQMEEISRTLSRIDRPTPVRVEHYYNFHNVTSTGMVTAISIPHRFIKLGEQRIYFEDIYRIDIVDVPTGRQF